ATQVNPEKGSPSVSSTVSGPCDPCEPKKPFLRRIFKRDAKDPCCQDHCDKDHVAKVPETGTTAPVASAPPVAEPSKTIEQRPIVKAPTAPSAPSDWRKSWGKTTPQKPEEPIVKSPSTPSETVAITPKPLAQSASEPASTKGKDEKTP